MAVGNSISERTTSDEDPVLVTKESNEHIKVGQAIQAGSHEILEECPLPPASKPEARRGGQKDSHRKINKSTFLYLPDCEDHFRRVFLKSPKFLQNYTERTTQQEHMRNEFASLAKRNLPDYYYKNSGDPSSNRWLRTRATKPCSGPHSRIASAASSKPRPSSRQGSSNQLPGMENPKCFASEINNFEIVTPLESMSMTFKGWAFSEQAMKKHPLSGVGLRSVRFGEVQEGSAKVPDGFMYTSLPPTPNVGQNVGKGGFRPSATSTFRPQSW